MPSHRAVFYVVGVICIILAILGGLMYPINTMSIFEFSAYVISVSLGALGILYLLCTRGLGEEL
jgi:hypothetical protein